MKTYGMLSSVSAGVVGLACVALIPHPARAAWPTDPRINVPVCTAPGLQTSPKVVPDGTGGAIISWSDRRVPGIRTFAQHIMASGVVDPVWPADGRALSSSVEQFLHTSVSDGAGGAIVAWMDRRSGTRQDIYAQHVLADGTLDPAWPVDGDAVCTAGNTIYAHPAAVGDGTGGVIVVWMDNRNGADIDIYAHHLLASGVDPSWPTDGRALCVAANDQFYPCIVADGAGGAIVAWEDARAGDEDVYAHHVMADGRVDPGWPSNGRALCAANDDQENSAIVTDGAGGAIVCWDDLRNGAWDVYSQHVLASGLVDPAWPADGSPVIAADHDQYVPFVIPDGAGGAIVAWEDFRSGSSLSDVYVHHLLASGVMDPLWPANGRALCTGIYDRYVASIVTDGAGGAIVAWEGDPYGDFDAYAQHVLSSGALDPVWPADGCPLATADSHQFYTAMIPDGTGGAIVVWSDQRTDEGDIYAQRVRADGILGDDLPTSTLVSVALAEMHQGAVRLRWYVRLNEPATLTVYRTSGGGAWQALGVVIPDGTGCVNYDDAGVAPGARYGYRLGIRRAAGVELYAGEAWVDVSPASEDATLRVPSPVTGGEVTVSFVAPASFPVCVSLHDLAGRTVAERFVTGRGGRQVVNLVPANHLAPGVYLVRVTTDRPMTARVVVIR